MKLLLILPMLFLLSCKKDVPPFPTKHIFEQLPGHLDCTVYEIVKDNPLTVSDGKDLEPGLCPMSIIGFDIDESGEVFQWIRDVEKIIDQKVK